MGAMDGIGWLNRYEERHDRGLHDQFMSLFLVLDDDTFPGFRRHINDFA